MGLSGEQIKKGVAQFTGVIRRQQLVAEKAGVVVIEDFAHHPTAVRYTLQGLKEAYPEKRLVAVFEPRSNTSRRAFFQREYATSFDAADLSLLLEVTDAGGYSNTGEEIVALDVPKLVNDISKHGCKAISFASVSEILRYLEAEQRSGDLIVVMSNGDFGGLLAKLVAIVHQR
jgi:UDP-N-acetylmuramate: L-alanyl-gamma-D-glutamyl-meso-diaminopimelate ligase